MTPHWRWGKYAKWQGKLKQPQYDKGRYGRYGRFCGIGQDKIISVWGVGIFSLNDDTQTAQQQHHIWPLLPGCLNGFGFGGNAMPSQQKG